MQISPYRKKKKKTQNKKALFAVSRKIYFSPHLSSWAQNPFFAAFPISISNFKLDRKNVKFSCHDIFMQFTILTYL